MKPAFFLLFCILVFGSCDDRIKTHFANYDEIIFHPAEERRFGSCNQTLNYTLDTNHLDHCSKKFIRVNFHFTNSLDSAWNYNGQEAVNYAMDMLNLAMEDVADNKKMKLPIRNETPVLPTLFEYVLSPDPDIPGDDGIYTHYDDDLFFIVTRGKDRNNFSRDVIKRYAVRPAEVLNIFIMPHHPDSIRSETYAAVGSGIALGNAIKMCGIYESKVGALAFRSMMNHEIGHVFGLRHTWKFNDGCDDTPKHPGCWHESVGGQCDSLTSNNVMDYNAYQHAYSPCQIGKMHQNFARQNNKKRKLLIPTWCAFDESKSIEIRDSIHWNCHKDIEGNLTVADGGTLKLSCRLSLPKGAKITVQPKGTLILDNCHLHNDCGDEWLGIEVLSSKESTGKITCIGDLKIENASNRILIPDELP